VGVGEGGPWGGGGGGGTGQILRAGFFLKVNLRVPPPLLGATKSNMNKLHIVKRVVWMLHFVTQSESIEAASVS
jgi:hypothetical protein